MTLSAMLGALAGVRPTPLGLWRAWTGLLGGSPAVIVESAKTETGVCGCVRQLVASHRPRLLLMVCEGESVAENWYAGDLALVRSVRLCRVPAAISVPGLPEEPDCDRSPLMVAARLLSRAQAVINPPPELSLQTAIPDVAIGSREAGFRDPDLPRFFRAACGIECAVAGAHGFLQGAIDCSTPALLLTMITNGTGGDVAWEFRRQRARFLETLVRISERLSRADLYS